MSGGTIMAGFERYCSRCGAVCPLTSSACIACGTSLKITLPLNESIYKSLDLPLLEGEIFKKRYRIVRKVGSGGFGAVYLASDLQEHSQVAIKEISLSNLTSKQIVDATDSFKREVELLSTLNHRSIPQMHEQLTDPTHWYLVMDFVAGITLEQELAKSVANCLPLELTLSIGIQLCHVLEYLHGRRPAVIFRDLKPTNVMLTPALDLYLIDFGAARQYKPGKSRDTIAFGSPGYAAPEQYGRSQTDPRTDIYSLGVLLHQMLTGQDPSLDPFNFQSLRVYDQSLPVELDDLLKKMLEMEMERRSANIKEIHDVLQAILFSCTKTETLRQSQRTEKTNAHSKVQSAKKVSPTFPSSASPVQKGSIFSTIGVTVFRYNFHGSRVKALAWSPDGNSIVSCDEMRTFDIERVLSPSQSRVLVLHSGRTNDLAWSPDGLTLASASEEHVVRLWRPGKRMSWWGIVAIQLGFRSTLCEGHTGAVTTLTWSPNGKSIAAGDRKGTVYIWDAHTRKQEVCYKRHSDEITDLAWSPDGKSIASASLDHSLRIWSTIDAETSIWHWRRDGHASVLSLAWSPDGQRLVCGCSSGQVYMWNVWLKRQEYALNRLHKGAVTCVSWSPDGQRIASAGHDTTVQLWKALDGNNIFTYRDHNERVSTIAWSPDGQYLASAGKEAQLRVWKTV